MYPGLSDDQKRIIKRSIEEDNSIRIKLKKRGDALEEEDSYSKIIDEAEDVMDSNESFPVSPYTLICKSHESEEAKGIGSEESLASEMYLNKRDLSFTPSKSEFRKKYSSLVDHASFYPGKSRKDKDIKDLQKQSLAAM